MMNGTCPETTPSLSGASMFKNADRITSGDWEQIVDGAHIWMDYFSVPQKGMYHSPRTPGTAAELLKSINSIPAYIERCSHFFVLCPTIQHKDLADISCGFGSWP